MKIVSGFIGLVGVLVLIGLVGMVGGCRTGASVGVTGGTEGEITGTVSYPVSSNVLVSGEVTGNYQTGEVSGGIVVTFPKEPSASMVSMLGTSGAVAALRSPNDGGWVYRYAAWDYKNFAQGKALEQALREGATITRQ